MARHQKVKIGDCVCIEWEDITEQPPGWRPKGEHIEPITANSFGVVVKLPDEESPTIEIIGDDQINGDFEGRAQCKRAGVIKQIRIAPPLEKWAIGVLKE